MLCEWPAQDRLDLVRLLCRFNVEIEAAITKRQATQEA